jgi:hypothetical protein
LVVAVLARAVLKAEFDLITLVFLSNFVCCLGVLIHNSKSLTERKQLPLFFVFCLLQNRSKKSLSILESLQSDWSFSQNVKVLISHKNFQSLIQLFLFGGHHFLLQSVPVWSFGIERSWNILPELLQERTLELFCMPKLLKLPKFYVQM